MQRRILSVYHHLGCFSTIHLGTFFTAMQQALHALFQQNDEDAPLQNFFLECGASVFVTICIYGASRMSFGKLFPHNPYRQWDLH